ncbi:unnamed protein product [Coccothraustes coccothraustes]
MEVFQHQLLSLVFSQSMGEQAVVTGGGDGVGKAYSFRSGLTIVVNRRTFEKLNLHSRMLDIATAVPPITELATDQKMKVIQPYFTKNSVYEEVEKDLKDLDIGVLPSNVGMLHNPLPCHFLNGPNIEELGLFYYKAKVNIIQAVIPYGVSAPMTMYQNPGVITKTAEEFVSESLEYVTFGEEIFGCFTHEILIEFGCV